MEVRFIGTDGVMSLIKAKVYTVLDIEYGWYRIACETGEEYIYPPSIFEVVCEQNVA